MAPRNGMAPPGGRAPIRLVPDTITYTFERADGELVALAGYRKGPGCPVSVAIEVDEAIASVDENEPSEAERETMAPRRYLARLLYAERTLRAAMLRAVVPGLTAADADLLASDGGGWQAILVELGWRQSDEEIAARAEEADDDPEARAGAASLPTGEDASPASSQPTPARSRSV